MAIKCNANPALTNDRYYIRITKRHGSKDISQLRNVFYYGYACHALNFLSAPSGIAKAGDGVSTAARHQGQ